MKRVMAATLALLIVGGVLLTEQAEAGWLDKWKNKDKDSKDDWVPRYDNHPTMSFQKGVLSRGLGQSWELEGVALHFAPNCLVTNETGEEGSLSDGREALVVGSRLGNTMIVQRVRILKPDNLNEGLESSSQVIPSDVDPTVGEGSGPE